jgi:hypothetical protein
VQEFVVQFPAFAAWAIAGLLSIFGAVALVGFRMLMKRLDAQDANASSAAKAATDAMAGLREYMHGEIVKVRERLARLEVARALLPPYERGDDGSH